MYSVTFMLDDKRCWGYQYADTKKAALLAAQEWNATAPEKLSIVAKVKLNSFGGYSVVGEQETVR